jgi:hypothetical protein
MERIKEGDSQDAWVYVSPTLKRTRAGNNRDAIHVDHDYDMGADLAERRGGQHPKSHRIASRKYVEPMVAREQTRGAIDLLLSHACVRGLGCHRESSDDE